MSKFFIKIFNKNIFIILIIGGFVFGLIKYIDYRFNLFENQFEIIKKENFLIRNNFEYFLYKNKLYFFVCLFITSS